MIRNMISRGSNTPVPVASWFGALPDRLTLLTPTHIDNTGSPTGIVGTNPIQQAAYLNQFIPYNTNFDTGGANAPTASFGGFTTAPDGSTATAQLLVESTGNTVHFAQSGFQSSGQGYSEYPRMKFSGFFKSSNRRVVLTLANPGTGIFTSHFPVGMSGIKAIFDLVSGVFVDVGIFGSRAANWVAFPAEMTNFGNGWYRCSIEAQCVNAQQGSIGSPVIWCNAYLDNGTGTGAESTTYAGDGVSGVYGWKVCCLPSQCWGVNNVSFFDGFDDNAMKQIDLTNSKAQGFKWYMGGPVPYLNALPVISSSVLSCSNSVLTLIAPVPDVGTIQTYVAKSLTAPAAFGTGYVGYGFLPPALFEFKMKWNYTQQNPANSAEITPWSWSLEWIMGQPTDGAGNGPENRALVGRETNFFESGFDGASAGARTRPLAGGHAYYRTGTSTVGLPTIGAGTSAIVGVPTWTSLLNYKNNDVVFDPADSNVYRANGNITNGGAAPHLNASWILVGSSPPILHTDIDNIYHNYQYLVLPYSKQYGNGMYICFMDGILAGIANVWGPVQIQDNYLLWHQSDGQHMTINLGAGQDGTWGSAFWDSVTVTQQ